MRQETRNVGKTLYRRMLLKILLNLKFPTCQNLALRGDENEYDSNLTQLLCLRANDDSNIKNWLQKKADKYSSPEI